MLQCPWWWADGFVSFKVSRIECPVDVSEVSWDIDNKVQHHGFKFCYLVKMLLLTIHKSVDLGLFLRAQPCLWCARRTHCRNSTTGNILRTASHNEIKIQRTHRHTLGVNAWVYFHSSHGLTYCYWQLPCSLLIQWKPRIIESPPASTDTANLNSYFQASDLVKTRK